MKMVVTIPGGLNGRVRDSMLIFKMPIVHTLYGASRSLLQELS